MNQVLWDLVQRYVGSFQVHVGRCSLGTAWDRMAFFDKIPQAVGFFRPGIVFEKGRFLGILDITLETHADLVCTTEDRFLVRTEQDPNSLGLWECIPHALPRRIMRISWKGCSLLNVVMNSHRILLHYFHQVCSIAIPSGDKTMLNFVVLGFPIKMGCLLETDKLLFRNTARLVQEYDILQDKLENRVFVMESLNMEAQTWRSRLVVPLKSMVCLEARSLLFLSNTINRVWVHDYLSGNLLLHINPSNCLVRRLYVGERPTGLKKSCIVLRILGLSKDGTSCARVSVCMRI